MCVPKLVMAANRCCHDPWSDSFKDRTQVSEAAALIESKTLTLALSVEVGLHVEPLLFHPLLELSHVFQGLFCTTDAHIFTAPSSKPVVAHTAYIHTPVKKAVIESAGIVTKIVCAH